MIYLSENDMYKGKSAHHAVVEFLKEGGIAGATVHHCIEGYGVHEKIHTASLLRLGTDLPVIIQAVDREEKIRDIIPELKRILPEKLIIIEDIEIVSGERFTEIS
jgi:PII-like signaling protein